MSKSLEKSVWNKFVAENSSPSAFLQSWEWGEYQESLGFKVERITIGNVDAVAQAIVRPLVGGKKYLEVPKGPVMRAESRIENLESSLMRELKKIANENKAVFVRINPPYEISKFELRNSKFESPKILLRQQEPSDTLLVDLTKSDEELVANMHEKSRYNIRLAQKRGIVIRDATGDAGAFEKFLDLLEETAKRDGITLWSRERFKKFREHFMNHNSPQPSLNSREGVPPLKLRGGEGELYSPYARLLVGESNGQILAGAVVMLFGDSATYLYAASSSEKRELNAPSLVLWEAIRLAKNSGKKWYDMWGVAPRGAGEDHSWAGITRFKSRYIKLGVTGRELRPVGTHDLVLEKNYYKALTVLRKIKSVFGK